MELVLDDPDNPLSKEELEAFLNRINNPKYDKVDFSGAENLFNSIDAELQLKKHDRDRLIVFESQCLSAINYLGQLLIDYPSGSENFDRDKVSNLSEKFKLVLSDIMGRIKLYENKEKKLASKEKVPDISGHSNFPLINKEVSQRHYAEVFHKLMLSKDTERVFKELKEGGLKYISEDFLEYIDQVILAKHRFISDLTISNPQSKPENIGVPVLTEEIERAELIRDLIYPQSSDNLNQTLSNSTKEMEEATSQNVFKSNNTSDNSFDKFIDEIFNLDIKCFKAFGNSLGEFIKDYIPDKMGIPHSLKMEIFLDLRHYTKNGNDDYEYKIKQLQQNAITVLLKLPLDQIKLQLRRLDEREERFSRFWIWYNEFSKDFQEWKFRSDDIEKYLESFFNIPKFEDALISHDFMNELNVTAKFKQACLSDFIGQVKAIIAIPLSDVTHSVHKPEIEKETHPKARNGNSQSSLNVIMDRDENVHTEVPKSLLTNMTNLDIFIEEVLNLEVKLVELYITSTGYILEYTPEDTPGLPHKKAMFLSLQHYDQHQSNYEFNLIQLQQAAITELIKLSPEQIRLQLNRLDQWDKRFKRFWKWYKEIFKKFREGELQFIDLEIKLESFFNVRKYKEALISQDFIFDLHDAAMFKHNCLKGLLSQVNSITEKPLVQDVSSFSKWNEYNLRIDNLKIIKVKDYRPLYHDLLLSKSEIQIDDEIFTIQELFNNHPDAKINSENICSIETIDKLNFWIDFSKLETEKQILEYLQSTFENFMIYRGAPLHWIALTIAEVEFNPTLFPKMFIGLIKKTLLEWYTFYKETNFRLGKNPDPVNNYSKTLSELNPKLFPLPLEEYFKESASSYSENYDSRLKHFLDNFESNENEFIDKEIEFLKYSIYDLQNSDASFHGFSLSGYVIFRIVYLVAFEIGNDKYNSSTKEKIAFLENRRDSPAVNITEVGINSLNIKNCIYNQDQLSLIFDKLVMKGIVYSNQKNIFISIFSDPKKEQVFWNHSIRGAQAGLFDLMERIKGEKLSASYLKLYFKSNIPIHDRWRDKLGNPTKLIDAILKEI